MMDSLVGCCRDYRSEDIPNHLKTLDTKYSDDILGRKPSKPRRPYKACPSPYAPVQCSSGNTKRKLCILPTVGAAIIYNVLIPCSEYGYI